MHRLGLTATDVRALAAAGYLWHRGPAGSNGRRPPPSRRAEDFLTHDDTLVALTEAGETVARQQLATDADLETIKPVWNEQDNRLYWNGQVVRVVRHDAAEVRLVLRQCQDHEWCPCLENPFPSQKGSKRKRRLADTIRRLNEHQAGPWQVHFGGDGRGGVCWELRHVNL